VTLPSMPDAGSPDEPAHPMDDSGAGSPPAAAASPAAAPAPPGPIRFPLSWLLEHASGPIQYRAIKEVARLQDVLPPKGQDLPLASRAAITLAITQRHDGVWHGSMLGVPASDASHFKGVGTIHATRRMLEYGWHRDTPPLNCARRTLFRLLAEDESPEFLYEFGSAGNLSEDTVRRGRAILREAAAAALAQAGYEGDPRLRGAARRIVDRVVGYLRSPLAKKPFVRFGNQHALPAEAAPPSIHALAMLAHMPLFRHEHYDAMERIYDHLAQPAPRMEPVQMCGREIVAQPHLVLGDPLPTRNAGDADLPFALYWLELMARLGYLRRHEGWARIFDRYLDSTDAQGVFRPSKGMALTSANPFTWHMYPIEERGEPGVVDATFRLGLIGRLAGRTIEVV